MAARSVMTLRVIALVFVVLALAGGLLGHFYFEAEATRLKQAYFEQFGAPEGASPGEIDAFWSQDADLAARMKDAWVFSMLSKVAMVLFAVLAVVAWLMAFFVSRARSAGRS